MGFAEPSKAIATVRKWHYGSYPATRAAAARAHLTELLPALLSTLSTAGNADEALAKFDNFLSRLPTGVQLFALLRNPPQSAHAAGAAHGLGAAHVRGGDPPCPCDGWADRPRLRQ
jgi:glutamine synthetase adenylyltransferase